MAKPEMSLWLLVVLYQKISSVYFSLFLFLLLIEMIRDIATLRMCNIYILYYFILYLFKSLFKTYSRIKQNKMNYWHFTLECFFSSSKHLQLYKSNYTEIWNRSKQKIYILYLTSNNTHMHTLYIVLSFPFR